MAQTQNTITELQNQERLLDHLRAASRLYSQAKTIASSQALLTVLIPLALATLAVVFPSFKAWAALYGIFVSIADVLFLDRMIQDRKKDAAKVQESFDTELFQLSWNNCKVGDRPTPELIHRAASRYKKQGGSEDRLRSWYTDAVGQLPLRLGRLIAQRTNISWDNQLRTSYINWLYGLLGLLIVAVPVVGLAVGLNLDDFILSLLTPVLPVIIWLGREIRRQRESIGMLDRLQKYVESAWQAALTQDLSDDENEKRSRTLQDEIYAHRQSNQPIFDWIYKLLRTSQQDQADAAVDSYVRQALQHLNSNQINQ